MSLLPDIFDHALEAKGAVGDVLISRQSANAALAIETYEPEFIFGTEPPGPGWEYAGEMKWVRRSASDSPVPESALIDVEAVALMLDCSTSHVSRMADDGLMPAPRKLGSLVRWSRQELLEWIAGGCPSSEKEEEPPAEQPHVIY